MNTIATTPLTPKPRQQAPRQRVILGAVAPTSTSVRIPALPNTSALPH